ncbi:MOSC domain-containing protein [Slackia exigua]|uniref:MOSC domain-containing protein n=1 Tax=Slackia exigua TaxID=84109 RepID=UPI00210D0C2E|nr:MOSC domain-containing protein [Slackia exigua]
MANNECVVVFDGAVDTKTDDALDEAVTRDAQRIFGGMPFERAEAVAAAQGAQARVRSINISKRKGQRKTPLDSNAQVEVREQFGVAGDAHAGDWHRQVSFLAYESIERAQAAGLDVTIGDFAENFTTDNLNCMDLPIGTQLAIGDEVLVEISQIGKVCHTRCAIYYMAGDCIFPREGIFGVVLRGGAVKAGDAIDIVQMGDGTCAFSPDEALAEVEAARQAGTL